MTKHARLLFQDVSTGFGPARAEHRDVLIADGLIREIRPTGEISTREADEVFAAPGAALLPGLRDQHLHLRQYLLALVRVDVEAAQSPQEALDLLRTTNVAPDGWIIGHGYRAAQWRQPYDKALLDEAFGHRKVAVISKDLHSLWFSSAALAELGLSHDTGVLREEESFAVMGRIPAAGGLGDEDAASVKLLQDLAAQGITQVLDFEVEHTALDWQRRFHAHGGLPVRVQTAIQQPLLTEALSHGWTSGQALPQTDRTVTVGPCKVWLDGSLNTKTAYCDCAYPGVLPQGEEFGLLVQDLPELIQQMVAGGRAGITFAIHAIGDRANTLALDCFEQAGVRGRIEHAQFTHERDLARFAALDIAAGIQPAHLLDDRDVAAELWAGHTHRLFMIQSMLQAGVRVEFGSDAPVSPSDPWLAMAAAVTRTGDERPGWHPEQQISVAQALQCSVASGPRLAVGDVADVMWLPAHPEDVSVADLAQFPVSATVMNGRVSHRAH